MEIKGGKYPINMEYTKEIEEKPEIIIGLQGSSITKEEFLDKVFLLKENIIDGGYKPRGFHISYNEFGEKGALIYSIKLEENQLNLSKEQLNSIKMGYDTGTKDELQELAAKNKLLLGVYIIGGLFIIVSIGIFITIFEKRRRVSNLN